MVLLQVRCQVRIDNWSLFFACEYRISEKYYISLLNSIIICGEKQVREHAYSFYFSSSYMLYLLLRYFLHKKILMVVFDGTEFSMKKCAFFSSLDKKLLTCWMIWAIYNIFARDDGRDFLSDTDRHQKGVRYMYYNRCFFFLFFIYNKFQPSIFIIKRNFFTEIY